VGSQLCGQLRLYYNLFQPVMRLIEKRVVVDRQGHRRVRLIYGQAQTPYERVRATGILSHEQELCGMGSAHPATPEGYDCR